MLHQSEVVIRDSSEQKSFIEYVMQNEPPYRANSFDLEWYPKFGSITELAINSFCTHCDAERVFKTAVNPKKHNIFDSAPVRIPLFVPTGAVPADPPTCYSAVTEHFNAELTCAMCGEKHYYSLLFKGNSLIKIGQYPSYASAEIQKVRKYKNLIDKYYPELTRSINAYSQGMGVAAFVYLRRILEHLVEKRFAGDKTWKFEEKLREVEKTERVIPEELETIKVQIYSILSKGIHEYEEEECLELYLAVLFVITRMLDVELEKKSRAKDAKAAIAAIKSKLQEGK